MPFSANDGSLDDRKGGFFHPEPLRVRASPVFRELVNGKESEPS